MREGRPIPNEPDLYGDPDRYVNPHEPPLDGANGPTNPYTDQIRSGILSTEQIKELPPPDPLIAGYLNLNSLAQMFGPSGLGKSFLAKDLALHISRGSWWQGHQVVGGPVLYIAAEGASGLGPRLQAWERANQSTQEVHPMHWLPWAVNVSDIAWANALAEVCADLRPSLVVLDTLARSIVGAEENSARDMGVVIANLDRIKDACGACVLLVHHTGHAEAGRGRGSSALKGALDTELELTGEADSLILRVTKQKDGPEPPPMRLALKQIDGTDSCAIVHPRQAGPANPARLATGPAETLDALMDIDIPGGVPSGAWQKASPHSESTFYRHRAGLIEQGLVINVGSNGQPRYRPASALEEETP